MYKEGIVACIVEEKSRTGSSLPAIKKHVEANLPKGKTYQNGTLLKVLRDMVSSGDLVKTKGSYKLSAEYKKKLTVSIGRQST